MALITFAKSGNMTNEKLYGQLDHLRDITGRELSYNKVALLEEFHAQHDREGTLGMKVLAVVGQR